MGIKNGDIVEVDIGEGFMEELYKVITARYNNKNILLVKSLKTGLIIDQWVSIRLVSPVHIAKFRMKNRL